MYISTYVHVYIYIYIYTYIYVHTYTYIYIYVHICTYIYMSLVTYILMYILASFVIFLFINRSHVRLCAHLFFSSIYIYIFIYIHIWHVLVSRDIYVNAFICLFWCFSLGIQVSLYILFVQRCSLRDDGPRRLLYARAYVTVFLTRFVYVCIYTQPTPFPLHWCIPFFFCTNRSRSYLKYMLTHAHFSFENLLSLRYVWSVRHSGTQVYICIYIYIFFFFRHSGVYICIYIYFFAPTGLGLIWNIC